MAAALAALTWPRLGGPSFWFGIGAAIAASVLLFLAGVTFWSSHVGKKRVCDRLVAALAFAGDERVLDAGCGSRLALIGCAKKLDAGKAVGVDLWAVKDLSDNSCAAPLTNAAIEGVAERIEVETGDITNLQFPTLRSTRSSR